MGRPSVLEVFVAIMVLSFAVDAGLMALYYTFKTVLAKYFVKYFCGWRGLLRAPLLLVWGLHLLTMEVNLFNFYITLSFAFLLSYFVGSLEELESSDASEYCGAASNDTNENDESEEIEFVELGLYMLLVIMLLHSAVNLGRTLIRYSLLSVFAQSFVAYQFLKVLGAYLVDELTNHIVDIVLERYVDTSTSPMDLLEDPESSDANQSRGVGSTIGTNDSDKSELGSSDTNETNEGLSNIDETNQSEVGSSNTNENDESDEGQSEVDGSEVESSDMDESVEVEVISNDADESDMDASDMDEIDEIEVTRMKAMEASDMDQSDDYIMVPL